MFGPIRVVSNDLLLGFSQVCPECGRTIQSTGEMYYDEGTKFGWSIGYWCPNDKETFRIWTPKDKPLLDQLSANLEISTLPIWNHSP